MISNEINSYLNDCLVLAIDELGPKIEYLSGNASFDICCVEEMVNKDISWQKAFNNYVTTYFH